MKNQKIGKDGMRRVWKIQGIICLSFILFFSGKALSQGLEWGPFPWGSTLEELNRAYTEKNIMGQAREDKYRIDIELQCSPTKAVKARKGSLLALVWSTDPSKAGRLYGYTYEEKFFGRVILFKDYPEIFPETIIGTLKKKYPQGRTYRGFARDHFINLFEYKTEDLYVFTTERGVFFYEPSILEKVAKKYETENEQERDKFEKKQPDILNMP